MKVFLGIDVGSVTTKFALMDEERNFIYTSYVRTQGKPLSIVQQGLREISRHMPDGATISGVGTTGSGRQLAAAVVGADVVKNEITAHAVGASHFVPDVQTILEIGGQDSKLIIIRDGIVVDFSMNTVCAAGTGAFLDQQAARLNIPIDAFGEMALKSPSPVRIAGRCTVFAESDMIHKQQMGHRIEDILWGLCEAMTRNYLNNLGLGKEILAPVAFQGGVAFNKGIVRSFEEQLKTRIIVPPHHQVMGAVGAALLASEHFAYNGHRTTAFKGLDTAEIEYSSSSFECKACSNVCEIVQIKVGREVIARWGGRCDKWESLAVQ